jgi:hypothetical protein
MLFTYRDVVTHSRAQHTLPNDCHLTNSHFPPSDGTDDCPSLVSDSDNIFFTDEEDDVIQIVVRTAVRPLPVLLTDTRSHVAFSSSPPWTPGNCRAHVLPLEQKDRDPPPDSTWALVAHPSPVGARSVSAPRDLPIPCQPPHVTLADDLAAIASYEADEAYARACGAYESS